jgi:hypothetical protein
MSGSTNRVGSTMPVTCPVLTHLRPNWLGNAAQTVLLTPQKNRDGPSAMPGAPPALPSRRGAWRGYGEAEGRLDLGKAPNQFQVK